METMSAHSRALQSLFVAAAGAVSVAAPMARGEGMEELPWLARLSEFGRRTTDGRFGFLMKPVGGGATLEMAADEAFEPASAIKTLVLVHAMRLVQRGEAVLDEPMRVFTRMIGSCPMDAEPREMSVGEALRAMMQDSDNAATQALRKRFGDEAIRATAASLGMSKTLLRHRIGCADGPDGAYESPNATTLGDLARLYEAIVSPEFSPEVLAAAMELMETSRGKELPVPLRRIAEDEGAGLGVASETLDAFFAGTSVTQKGGHYDWKIGGAEYHHQTRAGMVTLAFRSMSSGVVPRMYVVAGFVNDASDEAAANKTATTLYWECLREPIRQALRSWAAASNRKAADVDDGSGEGLPDGEVDVEDLRYYLERFAAGDLAADVDDGSGTGARDGAVSVDDLLYFLARYEEGR